MRRSDSLNADGYPLQVRRDAIFFAELLQGYLVGHADDQGWLILGWIVTLTIADPHADDVGFLKEFRLVLLFDRLKTMHPLLAGFHSQLPVGYFEARCLSRSSPYL